MLLPVEEEDSRKPAEHEKPLTLSPLDLENDLKERLEEEHNGNPPSTGQLEEDDHKENILKLSPLLKFQSTWLCFLGFFVSY